MTVKGLGTEFVDGCAVGGVALKNRPDQSSVHVRRDPELLVIQKQRQDTNSKSSKANIADDATWSGESHQARDVLHKKQAASKTARLPALNRDRLAAVRLATCLFADQPQRKISLAIGNNRNILRGRKQFAARLVPRKGFLRGSTGLVNVLAAVLT